MLPSSGSNVPVIKLKRDVLPAPLGPIIPRASPELIKKLRSFATTTPPKDLEIFFSSKIDISVVSVGGDILLSPPFQEVILTLTLPSLKFEEHDYY